MKTSQESHAQSAHAQTSPIPGMSAAAYKSMVLRNGITPEKINALKASIERGKELVK